MDLDAVGQAIKELWAHTKFSGTKVVLGVANQKVFVRQIDLPYLEGDELKKSLPLPGRGTSSRCPLSTPCSTSTRWKRSTTTATACCVAFSSPRPGRWC